jgi:mannose-6-phosphate isomerase-like protein (cupin superfamily)
MANHIVRSSIDRTAGTNPKKEFIGRVNSRSEAASVARMKSLCAWVVPGQTPEFDEYTVVLRGLLRATMLDGSVDVHAGEAVIARRGERVRYATPLSEEAEFIAVCEPAFSPETVHRDS